ncbi:protein-disulfide reductase DsbD family protein [Tenacibaculum sp. TC6]|uniref:protein-disulfide reductase DsbD family protein n=1 Tax=Tenacibaculum sp. TC6 TaxID=3423223 RepID=UPI003D35E3AC
MKKYLLIILLIITQFSFSQIHKPVKWLTSIEKIAEREYNLVIKANIDYSWHLYSQNVPDGLSIATIFTFKNENLSFELIGKPTEEEGHVVNDPVFKKKIKYFEKQAIFKQRIKLKEDIQKIEGEVEFVACNDERCLPPTYEDLSFTIYKMVKEKKANLNKNKSSNEKKQTGIFAIFILSFLSGFAALLTPCVFPMIPMTVSFFTKQSKNKSQGIKNAVIYGLSIIVIYVLLGSLVTGIFGADALNALSTNVWFNLFFFILLVVFAASFLGAFEITLPSSWSTKVDAQVDKGGLIGIFFMALALAVVSFSCTGPIVGTLLVEAASKGGIAPVMGMLGFSTAIALPFTLFAVFPGWMNSLPKSGGWLNTVKVILGFLELALAFKFLSNADLVLQLHWLEREVFIAIWIAVFGVMALYLLGKIKLPHDSTLTHISVGRLSLGLITLAFVVYMLPGLWGAPLNLISAFPPPQHYSESPYGVGYLKQGTTVKVSKALEYINESEELGLPEGAHVMPPHDIIAFNDYDKGVAYAKKIGKPIMLDFTGHACVNCRKMEQNVWVKPAVLEILKNKVVLISLYVDDKRLLKEEEIVESKLRPGKKIKYIGQKWSELQTIKYKANSQPFYVLINHQEENLSEPIGYTPNTNEYLNWLINGITNFSK